MTDTAPAADTLHAVLPPGRGWPLFDAAATRRIEQAAAATAPPHALMARAGVALARLAQATQPLARSVLALAGPGNNGGDAMLAARWLHTRGWAARIVLLGDPARLPADAAWALAQAQAQGVPVLAEWPAHADADVLIDGLLGVGATRAPEGRLAAAVAWLNAAGRPILAVDLPTGLDGDRGARLGEHVVRAEHTLALLTLKPGLFTAEGRDAAGRVWLDTLGVPLPAADAELIGPAPGTTAPHASHKGRFGDVAVIGGAAGMTGAVLLAARAALAAGAGRVFFAMLDGGTPDAAAAQPELMQRPPAQLLTPAVCGAQTVVCGCGGGDAVAAALPPLIAHAARLVLDADALNAVAADSGLARALAARHARGRPTVITPHPLEAARLLGQTAAAVQADRPAAARELARRFGCVAVLKGSGTLVATPDGRLRVNASGNALLAGPGTGDVLAGWTGGAWARDAAQTEPRAAADVAAAAVYRHGAAADRAALAAIAPPSLRAGDLIEWMRGTAG